jgi:hypothetical protein
MPAGRLRFFAAMILTVLLIHVAVSQDRDPAKQREEQKKVQARIAEAARRASSTIDAMAYQRLSPKAEQKMLEEVAESLRGLSQDQIKTILDHLEAAVQAPDAASRPGTGESLREAPSGGRSATGNARPAGRDPESG